MLFLPVSAPPVLPDGSFLPEICGQKFFQNIRAHSLIHQRFFFYFYIKMQIWRFFSLYSFTAIQSVTGCPDSWITLLIPFSEILVKPAISMIHGTRSMYSNLGICVRSSWLVRPTHQYISPTRYLAKAPPVDTAIRKHPMLKNG